MDGDRVLIVDDDEATLFLAKSLLASSGYAVRQARTLAEAWKELDGEPFGVVLLACRLNGEDGLEACRQIRKQRRLPVVMLAGKGCADDKVAALEAGADACLLKPLVPADMLSRVRALMRHTTRRLAVTPPPVPEKRVGRFRILEKVGEGGMGCVYLAEDILLKRKVALKILQQKHSHDEEFVARFMREAHACVRLDHPNIIRAFDVGHEGQIPYYVMEYCPGTTLEPVLERGTLPITVAMDIVVQAARGLECAHANGLIHRDIKPGNILITAAGQVKLLDFGLVRGSYVPGQFHTATGVIMGTPLYFAPEQARGEREVDGRLDIYSLGCTFYHMLTGRPPFDADTPAKLIGCHIFDDVPDPRTLRPEVPEPVVKVMRKMTAKEAADRYEDCSALISALPLPPETGLLDWAKRVNGQ